MGLMRWIAPQSASTLVPTHPKLAPLVVPVPPDQAVEAVRSAVTALSGWELGSAAVGEVHLVRQSGGLGGRAAVSLTLKPAGPGTLIHAVSRGRSWWPARHRRNIDELFAAVRRSAAPAPNPSL
ncbi:unnamed protein product [Gemmataceae bacterium]|nr:unnamed protein product [Gemmataceae bacterium]VTU02097.1 unnamed protein product [Gemmataceae bacterium]